MHGYVPEDPHLARYKLLEDPVASVRYLRAGGDDLRSDLGASNADVSHLSLNRFPRASLLASFHRLHWRHCTGHCSRRHKQ